VSESISERKAELRRRLVEYRTSLPREQRRRADRRLCVYLTRFLEDRDLVDVAAFMPFRGEPDLRPALSAAVLAGRRIWMPVVDGATMRFRRWTDEVKMVSNRFGIPEPVDGPECPPSALSLVLAPLVAFSANGTRLGMGAGFYDRTFGFEREPGAAGPPLVGAAYALQQVETLPAEPWDVPLQAVITERGLHVFR
jgi:5-formyltetrahydrofolate cyclo-ligase